jgi:excisionase family DNA binding protein
MTTIRKSPPLRQPTQEEINAATQVVTSRGVTKLLTPAEVATLFKVDPKTVTRWAKLGKLSSIRTLGGHRRYKEDEVLGLLNGQSEQRS